MSTLQTHNITNQIAENKFVLSVLGALLHASLDLDLWMKMVATLPSHILV